MGAATVVSSPVTDVNRSTCSDTNVSRSVKSSRRVFVRDQSSGAGVESIANFLADQKSGIFCRLAGYRSTISIYHDPVEGALVGKHSLVSEVMKGAFWDNPPMPKFTNTWDVNVVLSSLQEVGPNACLSQKLLALKLAMLLALVCWARGHELHAINPQAISWFDDKVVCHILGMTKTKTISKPKKDFEILKFPSSNNLEPVQYLHTYLNLTASQRETNMQKDHLFLSFMPPHQVVKICSIARWLKLVMEEAGIDMSKFWAHSARSAADSCVPLPGLSAENIAKLGHWSNVKTFYNFYKKEVQSSSENLTQKAVLSLS